METQIKKIKITPERALDIKDVLEKDFGNQVIYKSSENCLYFCDNKFMTHPTILFILDTYKVFLQSSMF